MYEIDHGGPQNRIVYAFQVSPLASRDAWRLLPSRTGVVDRKYWLFSISQLSQQNLLQLTLVLIKRWDADRAKLHPQRSPIDSPNVFEMGFNRYPSTVFLPVLISTVAVIPGWISIASPTLGRSERASAVTLTR